MRRRAFLRYAGAVGSIVVAGCGSPGPGAEDDREREGDEPGGNPDTGTNDIEGSLGESPEGLSVSETELVEIENGARVTGTVDNTGENVAEEIEVQVTLFGEEDQVVGQYYDNTEDAGVSTIEQGRQWEFAVEIPAGDLEGATRYRVDVDRDIDQNVNVDDGFTA